MDKEILNERLAIHEASHAVVAKLFEDHLHLRSMTIEPKQKEGTSKAAQQLGMIGVEAKSDVWVAPGVVALAGMIGETIASGSVAYVLQNKNAIVANPNQYIDTKLGNGDFTIFLENAIHHAHNYGSVKDYEAICLGFLIDILCSQTVWSVVESLRDTVLKMKNLTLDENELNTQFDATGYSAFVTNHKTNLLERFRKKSNVDPVVSELSQMLNIPDTPIL